MMRKPSAPPVARPASVQKSAAVVEQGDDEPEFDIDPSPSSEVTAERDVPTASAIASTPTSVGTAPTLLAATPTSPASTPTFTPPPPQPLLPDLDGDAEDVDMSARELDVLFEGEAPVDDEPAPKPRTALPRPKPSKSKAADFGPAPVRGESGAPPRRSTPPPLSGNVPKGIRPPAANPINPEDTDVLIASLGAELMDDEPEAGESVQAPAAPVAAASSVPRVSASRSFTAEGAPIDDDFEPQAKRPTWMWVAVGALAAVVIAIVAFAGGDDDGAEQAAIPRSGAEGAYSASMSAENEKDGGQAKPVVTARREAPVADAPPRADAEAPAVPGEGEAEAELAVGEVEEVEEVAEPEPTPAVPTEPAAEPTLAEPTPVAHTGGSHHKRKHRNKHRDRTVATSAPAPSTPTKAPTTSSKSDEDPDALLIAAKKALASGNNASAYSLAAKARRLKKTNDALQVMAKAGCRMGSENKAKAAFANLTFGMKAGIRSECRAKGIKLGL